MELQNKQFDKALQYGTAYLQTNPGDTEIALAMAQARYLAGDFAGAKTASEQLVASNAKPPEAALLLALRSNYELKNDAGTFQALEGLVKHYPQPKYWEDLLNNQLFRTKDDRGLRALYRLMDDTGTLDKGEEFAEMGATLVTGGFPNEAKQILERGLSSNTLDAQAKTRVQAELERAKSGAALDAKELPNAEKQLAGAKTANQMIGIGKLYFSAGDYAKAADAIQKGLAKGGATDADDANLLLGIAQARAGQAADAQTAFSAVKNPTLADVARLWKLKLDTPATAPARRNLHLSPPQADPSRSILAIATKKPRQVPAGAFFSDAARTERARFVDVAGYREAVFQSRPISANFGSLIASNAFAAAALLPCRFRRDAEQHVGVVGVRHAAQAQRLLQCCRRLCVIAGAEIQLADRFCIRTGLGGSEL